MSKRARVLELLLQRGDRGLNRFEALERCRDHVLPSTCSALMKLGVHIEAEAETVTGHAGHPTRLARYRIPASERAHAREILVGLQRKTPAARTTGAGGAVGGQAHVRVE